MKIMFCTESCVCTEKNIDPLIENTIKNSSDDFKYIGAAYANSAFLL